MRRFAPGLLLALSATFAACDGGTDDTEVDTEVDTEAGTEADTEADTEEDTEADTEEDTEADTGVVDCPADLDPQDDGGTATETLPSIVISEVAPGDYVELFNTTDQDIALSGVSHQFCWPFAYEGLSSLAGSVTVPANGYAAVDWPGGFPTTEASGEFMLYLNGSFGSDVAIADYICWGDGSPGRKTQAENVGKWSGACAGVPTDGVVARAIGTDGTSAADYITNEAREANTCTPE